MYSVLNEVFGWGEASLPHEKLILISDSLSAEGSFLLPHFVNFFIKAKQKVIIIGLEQGFSHYLAISKKLGINLQQAHATGQLVYINGVASPYNWTDPVTTETNNPATAAIQSIANANLFSLDTFKTSESSADPLEKLYRMIEKHISSDDSKSVCVLVDNLSVLSPVVGEEAVVTFVHYVRSLVEEHSQLHQNSSCAVVLGHHDVDPLLITALSHASDLLMKVEGFKTGYSNEEDGQVCKWNDLLDNLKLRNQESDQNVLPLFMMNGESLLTCPIDYIWVNLALFSQSQSLNHIPSQTSHTHLQADRIERQL